MYCIKYKRIVNAKIFQELHPNLEREASLRGGDIVIHCRTKEDAEALAKHMHENIPPYITMENFEVIEIKPVTIKPRKAVILSTPPLQGRSLREVLKDQEAKDEEADQADDERETPESSNRVKP